MHKNVCYLCFRGLRPLYPRSCGELFIASLTWAMPTKQGKNHFIIWNSLWSKSNKSKKNHFMIWNSLWSKESFYDMKFFARKKISLNDDKQSLTRNYKRTRFFVICIKKNQILFLGKVLKNSFPRLRLGKEFFLDLSSEKNLILFLQMTKNL